MDTTSLRQGYAELIAEARRGGFGHLPAHLSQRRALRV
jgi:hypothetical protein